MLLEGKTVVVTGGNSGIGEGISRTAAAEGAAVVIDYVAGGEYAEKMVAEITEAGGRAVAVEADVSKVADLQKLIDTAVSEFGRLDVWVNNAGIEVKEKLAELTEENYDKLMGVNLKGAVFGASLAVKQFLAQGEPGVVVNVSSVHEEWSMPVDLAYCVSKGGMRMLAKTGGTDTDLSSKGIRIVNVAPGAVLTSLNTTYTNDPAQQKKFNETIPAGRIGQPEDIANAVCFVASDRASYITATTLTVDGGLMEAWNGI